MYILRKMLRIVRIKGYPQLTQAFTSARMQSTASLASEGPDTVEKPDPKAFLMSTARRSLESALEGCLAQKGSDHVQASAFLTACAKLRTPQRSQGCAEGEDESSRVKRGKNEKIKDKKVKAEKGKKKKKKKKGLLCVLWNLEGGPHIAKLLVGLQAPAHPLRSRASHRV